VVVGDIVLLYEGDVVPADGVLLSGISLFTGQGFGFGL
jgi:magnesium-transporting ATPase (P-type)